MKDIQAQVLAIDAGLLSRRKAVEATGYDIEEIDRENAADAARATELGLGYRTKPGETQGARATPEAASRNRRGLNPHAILVCDPRPCRGRGSLDL